MLLDELHGAFVDAANLVPVDGRVGDQGGGKGEVGGAPDAVGSNVAGSDGQIGEGDVGLFTEAECGNGFGLCIPVEAVELIHFAHIPAAVAHVLKAFIFQTSDVLISVWVSVHIGEELLFELIFQRHTELADTRKEVDPWEEKPGAGSSNTVEDVSTDEVETES